jgi:hypothetical protein
MNDVQGCIGDNDVEMAGNGPRKGGRVRGMYSIGTHSLEHPVPKRSNRREYRMRSHAESRTLEVYSPGCPA